MPTRFGFRMASRTPIHVPTPAETALIQRVVEAERGRSRNPPRPPREDPLDHEEYPTPETYVAYTGTGGVPALSTVAPLSGSGSGSGTFVTNHHIPGTAELDVYRLLPRPGHSDEELIHQRGLSRKVHNLGACSVPPRTWVLLNRDKFGRWIIVRPITCSTACPDPGWDHCERVVLQAWSECSAGEVVSHELVAYWYFCQGTVVNYDGAPCPRKCDVCPVGVDPGNTLTLTVSGVTDGSLSGCTAANGTFTLTRSSFLVLNCLWDSAPFALSTGQAFWRVIATTSLTGGVAGKWEATLFIKGQPCATLAYHTTTHDCALPAVLDLASGTGSGTGQTQSCVQGGCSGPLSVGLAAG